MNWISVSDVHLHSSHDPSYRQLNALIASIHQLFGNNCHLILLGDIFDLMVGNHVSYFNRFMEYFKQIEEFLVGGGVVHYFEGNHDLHLTKLYQLKFEKFIGHQLHFYQSPQILKFEGTPFYFTHGDECDPSDHIYPYYRRLLNSAFCRYVANEIMPLKILDVLGNKASKLSRAKGKKYFYSETKKSLIHNHIKNNLIDNLSGCEYLIAGHTHIPSLEMIHANSKQILYVNGGYFPAHQQIICGGRDGVKVSKITDYI